MKTQLYCLTYDYNVSQKFLQNITYKINFAKSNTHPWLFFTFLNCHNGTKLRKASHINTEEETEMYSMNSETRFFPMYPFEPLWEYQKTVGFVTFAGKIKRKYQEKNILATSFIVRFEKCLRFLFVSFLLTLTMFLF